MMPFQNGASVNTSTRRLTKDERRKASPDKLDCIRRMSRRRGTWLITFRHLFCAFPTALAPIDAAFGISGKFIRHFGSPHRWKVWSTNLRRARKYSSKASTPNGLKCLTAVGRNIKALQLCFRAPISPPHGNERDRERGGGGEDGEGVRRHRGKGTYV